MHEPAPALVLVGLFTTRIECSVMHATLVLYSFQHFFNSFGLLYIMLMYMMPHDQKEVRSSAFFGVIDCMQWHRGAVSSGARIPVRKT